MVVDAKLIEDLFPGLAAVRVVAVIEDGGVVRVDAQAKAHSYSQHGLDATSCQPVR